MPSLRPADKLELGKWFRWCGNCQKWRPLNGTHFYKNSRNGEWQRGFDTICKLCWYERNNKRLQRYRYNLQPETESLTCIKCGQTKDAETEFYKDRNYPSGYRKECKECKRSQSRNYWQTHRAKKQ